jgi:hypothetical protein
MTMESTEAGRPLGLGSTEGLSGNAQAVTRERPMLFSAPMVRALLAGTKTQTRRVATPKRSIEPMTDECPYGQPGDRLWVRERFQPLLADGVEIYDANWKTGQGYAIGYPATDGIQEYIDADDNLGSACKPSIHMPRWASRITLEVTGVRVERLNDISEVDALYEGVTRASTATVFCGYVDAYAALWDQINGAGAWAANPWVWVMEFRRCLDLQPNVPHQPDP